MQIIALGGGGFSMDPENPRLDRYILSQARNKRPKVCFVPTATGDSERYCLNFYATFARHDCVPAHLTLFQRSITDLRSFILSQDVIYVGGGNTANLLAVWRVHGLDKILREAAEQGVVMCGISAGSLCWFECGVTDSFGPKLARLDDGLGFLKGSNCPHYDGEIQRRPSYQQFVSEGLPGGLAADDGCGLHFIGGKLHRVVSSCPTARAYQVELQGGKIVETPLHADYLD